MMRMLSGESNQKGVSTVSCLKKKKRESQGQTGDHG